MNFWHLYDGKKDRIFTYEVIEDRQGQLQEDT